MQTKPAVTYRDAEILKIVWYYRYITIQDILALQFSPGALTHLRQILSKLCGGADLQSHNYLCRFILPSQTGARERVYVLGSRGRKFLQENGYSTSWYFRPHKLKFLSYSYVLHNLILTRTMIAAESWAKNHPSFNLLEKRICYELAGKVVPDGWLLFTEQTDNGIYDHPILIEIDRGMEDKYKFRQHVRGRIEYVRRGEYQKVFNTNVGTIAYATTGQTAEYRETRRKVMGQWIWEILREMRLEDWAGSFKVASIEFGKLYDYSLFEQKVWYRPDSPKPLPLFT
jgi:hypothetical protein